MKKNILIFAYYSYNDPVFQSAVLPYFKGLSEGTDFQFILLTFEKEEYEVSEDEYKRIQKQLKFDNIIWYRDQWRSGRFKVFKKVYDFLNSIVISARLIKKYNIEAIYSEAFPGAIMGYHLAKWFNIQHLVHSFEPHTQYMVESGVWKESSWEAKLLSMYEKKIAINCSHIFTATEAMMTRIKSWGSNATLVRVPSCVDTEHFQFSEVQRKHWRAKNNIIDDTLVIMYLGKFGGMYMEEEAYLFFQKVLEIKRSNVFFNIVSHDDKEAIILQMHKYGIPSNNYLITKVTRDQVPGLISASDVGFVAVRQKPGKRFCSPIKNGEYWSCGLPILIPKGISDDYHFSIKYKIGVVLDDFSDKSIQRSINSIDLLLKDHGTSNRCREFAKKDRSIVQYQKKYRSIFESI